MSWSIEVIGTPEVKEAIASMCDCEGNLATATTKVGFKKLPHIENPFEARLAIENVIEELDKDNDGVFNDDWCEACDIAWSKGKDMIEAWHDWGQLLEQGRNIPYTNVKEYWGMTKRSYIRESAIRFYLYYKAGYEVKFEW